jgi:serine/threonine protein kinase/tetratricopeptide (TPR) repeat protein
VSRTPIELGPFELHAPLGRGGMGMVFQGVHTEQGVPVAVKVIEHSEGDAARTFRNEIRTMARLEHPGVVWVFDVGEVPRSAHDASGGVLPEGAPYIAMEFASRGTLHDLIGKVGWTELLPIVLQLLDALAHAHARGVVHRDLKPGNVLICGPEDLRPGLKLADFGIAHAAEKTEFFSVSHGPGAIGTLSYMSPEQIRAEMADYGPHTDLYALGNVVFHLLAGHVPFQGRSGMALVRAQLDLVLPDLVGPQIPSGLMHWLRTCTAKDPADRFQRAADAADALLSLGSARSVAPSLPERLADALPTVRMTRGSGRHTPNLTAPLDATTPLPEATGPITAELAQFTRSLHTLSLAAPRAPTPEPALPRGFDEPDRDFPDWRAPHTPRRTLQLLGAGLGLWGVRRLPMVGRIDERDQLWGALRAAHEQGATRVVVVDGAAGVGKTRLGIWLGERAHELGVGEPLRSDAWRPSEGRDVLQQLWDRYFGIGQDPRHSEPEARAARVVTVVERLGLPDPEHFVALLEPGDAAERRSLTTTLLRRIGRDRPVVLFLDDAGPSAMGLAMHLLELVDEGRGVPAVVVLTVSHEDVARDADIADALAELREHPGVEGVGLGPLPARFRGALVEEMLGLAPELAARVVERTEGNPQFTVQLISDWVERGLLELGPTGFRIRGGDDPRMPTSLAQVWDERVRQVLEGEPRRSGTLLERAAVLGLEVSAEEWRQVCDDPDGARAMAGNRHVSDDNEVVRERLVDRMLGLRLAERTDGGFRFAHGMLREALVERARSSRRLASHHRSCAAMLAVQPEPDPERLGRHLLGAGALEEAIEPLLRGVEQRQNTSGYRSALALLASAEDALRELSLPATDVRWATVWNLRATLYTELGQLDQAERWALRVLAHGDREGWEHAAVQSRLCLGQIHLSRGEWREAEHEFQRVGELAADPIQAGWAMAYRALLAGRKGQAGRRKQFTAEAVRRLRRAGSSRALGACWQVVGTSCRMEGQLAQADEALQRSLRLYRKLGHLFGMAEALAELGEVARARGEHAAATEHYVDAIHYYELTGSTRVVYPRVHLALVRMEAERFREAHDLLATVRLQLGRQGRELAVDGLSVFQLAAAAGQGDWEEFDHQLRQTEARRGQPLSPDAVRFAELAAERAGRAGKRSRVARVQRLLERSPRA